MDSFSALLINTSSLFLYLNSCDHYPCKRVIKPTPSKRFELRSRFPFSALTEARTTHLQKVFFKKGRLKERVPDYSDFCFVQDYRNRHSTKILHSQLKVIGTLEGPGGLKGRSKKLLMEKNGLETR